MLKLIYFIIVMVLALLVIFLGGTVGVASTLMVMVTGGDIFNALFTYIGIIILMLFFVYILIKQNNKVIKQRKKRLAEMAEAQHSSEPFSD